jgi:hypothetical protein
MSYAARRVRTGIAFMVLSVLGWLGGCSDSPGGPVCCDPLPEGLIVSDPVVLPVGAAARAGSASALASAADEVAYVTLPPGTVPNGSVATIRRVGDTESIITRVHDGGFDPVAVGAQVGDSIDIRVTDAAEETVFALRVAVLAIRPPIVVRTNPPRRKTGVPLNAPIVVVFSEPIDQSTLTGSAVQLRRGSKLIAGQVAFRDPEHVTVVFVPAEPLATSTMYTLTVTQDIRDLDGEPLETPVTVTFTTAASVEAYQEYFVDSGLNLFADQVGDSVHVRMEVEVMDGARERIEGAVVRFRGSRGIVTPETTVAGFAGVAIVEWKFLGRMGGPGPVAELSACASNSTARCDMYWPVLVIGLYEP